MHAEQRPTGNSESTYLRNTPSEEAVERCNFALNSSPRLFVSARTLHQDICSSEQCATQPQILCIVRRRLRFRECSTSNTPYTADSAYARPTLGSVFADGLAFLVGTHPTCTR